MNRAGALALSLLALFACREPYDASRDAALKDDLAAMRRAIASHKAERGHYPRRLQDLVPAYLRRVPPDPITGKTDWRVTTEETVQPSADFTTGSAAAPASVVIDVHSSAPGADRDGVPYANY